jgi:regulator of replication initiation timing
VVRAGYELGQIETGYRELLRENEHLKMERATLRSAPRLEAIAHARLGLVPPAANQIVTVKPAKSASAPAPAPGEPKVAAVARKAAPRNP